MTPNSTWLRATGLTRSYGSLMAMAGVDLELRGGEIRGLVGPNGAGKTTLVKALSGEIAPDSGSLEVDGRAVQFRGPADARAAGIVDVPQELAVARNMSVADNVMLGHYPRAHGLLNERAKRASAQRALDVLSLDLPLESPVGKLQTIEQRLVMVARAIAREARLVLFDEPTAAASPTEVSVIIGAIRQLSHQGVSVLYVSHRLDEVVELCDVVTVMRDGRVIAEVAGEERTHSGLVRLMSASAVGDDDASAGHRRSRRIHMEPVLEVEGLQGGTLRDVDLTVRGGEILGVAGLTGSGASDLPLVICGALRSEAGSVRICGADVRRGDTRASTRAGLGCIAGDRSLGALPHHSIAHNVSLATVDKYARFGLVSRRRELEAVQTAMKSVALTADPRRPLSTLSGGNQQKAILGRWIASDVRVLLLIDPTAGVDVASRVEIHEKLLELTESGVGMLLVSTDLAELVAIADGVVVLERGVVKTEITGGQLSEDRILTVLGARDEPGVPA